MSAQVIHNGQKPEPLNIRTGVRQGYLLTRLLFLAAVHWLTRTTFARRRGIQWSFTNLEDLNFADDLTLLSHSMQNMKDKTQALKEPGAKVDLKINVS